MTYCCPHPHPACPSSAITTASGGGRPLLGRHDSQRWWQATPWPGSLTDTQFESSLMKAKG